MIILLFILVAGFILTLLGGIVYAGAFAILNDGINL